MADYANGMSPEEIARQLDTLSLADVHAAIAYYLRHRAEVEEYLCNRRSEADDLRRKVEEMDGVRVNLKAELTARLSSLGLDPQ